MQILWFNFTHKLGGETRGGIITDTVECYDPITDCWTEMKSLPKPRADHASCIAEGRLFVSGGVGEKKQKKPVGFLW